MSNSADLVRMALTVALLAVVFALASNANFYNSSMVDVFMALALGGALLTLAVVQPSWTNLAAVALCSLVLAGLDYRVLHFTPRSVAAFSFAGLSGLAVLGSRTIWSRKQDGKLLLYAFLPTILFLASEYMASTLLEYTEALHPKTFDLYLYSFDCSLRAQFCFLLGQLLARHLWLRFACLLFYIALPLPLALVYASHLRHGNKNAFPIMLAFLITGPMGVLFYNLLPATGPIYLFGPGFPWHPFSTWEAMHMRLATLPVKGARNAIPSLHMAWVLLAWWTSRGLSGWIRAIALAFVIFTVMATMGTGEHYFVDLVVAFPFALLVRSLCMYPLSFRHGSRRAAFLFGTFASLAWIALVSFATPVFWISPIVPWTLVIATISICCVLVYRLQNAEFMNEPAQTLQDWNETEGTKADVIVPSSGGLELMPSSSLRSLPRLFRD